MDTRDAVGMRERARNIALEVADRLSEPKSVACHTTPSHPMEGSLLANGNAGIALLLSEVGHVDEARSAQAQRHLALCAEQLSGSTGRLGLFSGLAGLGFACRAAGLGTGGRPHIRDRIRDAVIPAALHQSIAVRQRIKERDALTMIDTDVMYGLAGLGMYLLTEAPESAALENIVGTLIGFNESREIDGFPAPTWVARSVETGAWTLNLGLAHGAAGTISFLSIAMLNGVEYPGQRRAVEEMSSWLLKNLRFHENGRPWWPRVLNFEEGILSPPEPSSQLGWCYGTASVANSLRLASKALGRDDWSTLAGDITLAAFRDSNDIERVNQPHLCHGWAGLLQMILRAAEEWPETDCFRVLTDNMAERLMNQYDSAAPFGFRVDLGQGPQDDPGFLMGAAGVALALHSYASPRPLASSWDSLLLLAPPG
ncbi:lanthionine synthetase C family protein [Streptomyces lavendulae]|uniref:lanthionine synthetase C family protein n=1 Tax=Streptomyces lavendulae TaxID=1914 RepID=UPI00382292D4